MWLQNLANFTNALAVPLAFLDNNLITKKKKIHVKYLKSSSAKDPRGSTCYPCGHHCNQVSSSERKLPNSVKATKEGVGGYQDPAEA